MALLKQLNALIWSWSEMLGAAKRRAALLPLVLYGAVQVCLLLLVAGFAYRPLTSFVAPALRWRLGEAALHYPNNFFALRTVLGQTDPFLAVFLGALTTGAAVLLFAAHYGGDRGRFRAAWAASARRYWAIVAVVAIVVVASQLLNAIPFSVFGELAEENASRFRLVRALTIGVVMAVQALLVYAVPFILIGGAGLGRAIGRSASLAATTPVTTYLIVAVPAALELIPAWLSKKSATIAYTFAPEFLLVIMIIWVVTIALVNYATFGAATRFFMHATQDDAAAGVRR